MKQLSAVTAPILAKIFADRAAALDRVQAELHRLIEQNNRRNERLTAGDCRAPTEKGQQ